MSNIVDLHEPKMKLFKNLSPGEIFFVSGELEGGIYMRVKYNHKDSYSLSVNLITGDCFNFPPDSRVIPTLKVTITSALALRV